MDPVHADEHGFWFYDETWTHRYGPYATEQEADAACDRYARSLDGEVSATEPGFSSGIED